MAKSMASDAELGELIEEIGADDENDLAAVEALLNKFSEDPRLHFMKGSILAGRGRAIEAHASMSEAVNIAPGYALARYQLGFFEMTSGEAERALSTWGPLLAAGEDNYLRKFVEGMTHLIRDEFGDAIERFQQGIALNSENEPMNNDIHILIAECRKLEKKSAQAPESADDDEVSATALILGQFGRNRTIQ